jgi:hypothetical protein
MTISNDLLLAILSMDAYNRGYNSGLGDGNVGLGLTGRIGNAVIGPNSSNLDPPGSVGRDSASSFYAQSYTLNGRTIIAYRGTDTEFRDGADRPAFTMGAGNYATAQGNLAIDFYKAINGGSTATNSNITVTGHSLGGGLAGYVGANDNAAALQRYTA